MENKNHMYILEELIDTKSSIEKGYAMIDQQEKLCKIIEKSNEKDEQLENVVKELREKNEDILNNINKIKIKCSHVLAVLDIYKKGLSKNATEREIEDSKLVSEVFEHIAYAFGIIKLDSDNKEEN